MPGRRPALRGWGIDCDFRAKEIVRGADLETGATKERMTAAVTDAPLHYEKLATVADTLLHTKKSGSPKGVECRILSVAFDYVYWNLYCNSDAV